MQDKIVIHSSEKAIEIIKSKFPNISNFFGPKDAYKVFIAFILGFLPYVDFKGDIVALPYFSKSYQDWEYNEPYVPVSKIRIIAMTILRIFFKTITEHLAKRGYPSIPWILNTVEDLDIVRAGGAIGAVTDHPELAVKYSKLVN